MCLTTAALIAVAPAGGLTALLAKKLGAWTGGDRRKGGRDGRPATTEVKDF
jgi:hypothetical protein